MSAGDAAERMQLRPGQRAAAGFGEGSPGKGVGGDDGRWRLGIVLFGRARQQHKGAVVHDVYRGEHVRG